MAINEETPIVTACLEWLEWHNILACRTQSAKVSTKWGSHVNTGRPGWPDITVAHDGTFIGVEVKTPNKHSKQSPSQIEMEKRIEDAGCHYFIVRSVDDLHDWFALNGYVEKRIGS